MKDFIHTYWHWLIILGVSLAVMALVFSLNGLYDTRVDADIYASQMTSMVSGSYFSTDPIVMLRVSKPLYALIGGPLLRFASPYQVILALNIAAYILLALFSYALLRLLNFSRSESVLGTVWLITAYPLLKYGLALSTDMAGWFLSTATVVVGLYALKKDSLFYLSLASIIGFLGAITKESGALGLIALGLLVLWRFRKQGIRQVVRLELAAGLPALILYSTLLFAISGQAPTFLNSYQSNYHYFNEYYSFTKLILVEGSTFGLLWILSIAGFFASVRSRFQMQLNFKHTDFLIAAFIATLPVLLWPIFVSRIVFIQFLWLIPLALLGFRILQKSLREHSGLSETIKKGILTGVILTGVILLPIVCAVCLFIASAGGSLFARV